MPGPVRTPPLAPPSRPTKADPIASPPRADTQPATSSAVPTADRFVVGGEGAPPAPAPAAPRSMSTSPVGVRIAALASEAAEATPPALPAATAEKLARLQALVAGGLDRSSEAEVLDVLRGAGPAELDTLLTEVGVAKLLGCFSDRLIGPDNRSALLELLSQDRVQDLRPVTRAHVVSALQRGSTGGKEERAIRDLFIATTGADLTVLKNAIDAGGDADDLLKLLESDLDSSSLRAEIRAHIQREGATVSTGRVKVLSDIDDTLYANWTDDRYPKKTVYPGVRALYKELAGAEPPPDAPETRVTFLTARPEERTGLVEELTHGKLANLGVGESTVLSGSLLNLIGNDNIAKKKLENFERFSALYPEYGHVFIGDSGQGDAIAAAQMTAGHGDHVRGTFIHDVVGLSAAARLELREQGVYVFDTYAGAALDAHRLGLLDDAALARVARATIAELLEIPFTDAGQKAARKADLLRDVTAINAVLPASARVDTATLE